MRSYKAEDSYRVIGRGLIFACHIPEEKDVPKVGEHVLINDKEYIVDILVGSQTYRGPTVCICVLEVSS